MGNEWYDDPSLKVTCNDYWSTIIIFINFVYLEMLKEYEIKIIDQ